MEGNCDIELWPLYDGKNLTVAFIKDRDDGEEDVTDLLKVTLSKSEVLAFIDILKSAIQCETDIPAYGLLNVMFETDLMIKQGLKPSEDVA